MCNETYLLVAVRIEKGLSPEGRIVIACRVVFLAAFFLDRKDMKLVLFCIDVASDAYESIFVSLQNTGIFDFPLRVEIRQQGLGVVADLAKDDEHFRGCARALRLH